MRLKRSFPGYFITMEGVDGGGKTTQIRLLAEWLRGEGREVVLTREPGGTPLGDHIRELILKVSTIAPVPAAELALIFAARAQHVEEVIVPALERGAVVLCDRFTDASEAYQGGGRGLPVATIHELHHLLCRDLQPDLTLILDIEVVTGLERAMRRLESAASAESRFEQEGVAFLQRVRAAYQQIAARQPQRCRLIDASGSLEEVAARLRAVVAERLG